MEELSGYNFGVQLRFFFLKKNIHLCLRKYAS